MGHGFVGKAVANGFKGLEPVIYDKYLEGYNNTLLEVCDCDYVFVCVPTPESIDGSCNLSAIMECAENLTASHGSPVMVIKSTVPPGTAAHITEYYGLTVVSCPEFLVEKSAIEDFVDPSRIVIGAEDIEVARAVSNLHIDVGIIAKTVLCKNIDAELVKMASNTMLALKVGFFNLLYNLCEETGADFEMVRLGTILDDRVGEPHTIVPGPDGRSPCAGPPPKEPAHMPIGPLQILPDNIEHPLMPSSTILLTP